MHESSPAAEIARSPAAWERLAKEWLVEVIERTPLADVDDVPVGWMAREAPPLIAEILGQLSDPGPAREITLPPATLDRAASLALHRSSADIATSLPREFAALQSLLIQALDRELPQRDRTDFARAVTRLAEVFGAVQSAAMDSLASERAGTPRDEATGLAGPVELREWLRIQLSEERRTGTPFAIAHIEIDGVERVAEGYGEDAAERMIQAIAGVVTGHLERGERAFRVGDGQLAVVGLEQYPGEMAELAVVLAEQVQGAQGPRGPQLGVTVGIAACPANGRNAGELLTRAEEAAWSARAVGDQVSASPMQDP